MWIGRLDYRGTKPFARCALMTLVCGARASLPRHDICSWNYIESSPIARGLSICLAQAVRYGEVWGSSPDRFDHEGGRRCWTF